MGDVILVMQSYLFVVLSVQSKDRLQYDMLLPYSVKLTYTGTTKHNVEYVWDAQTVYTR